ELPGISGYEASKRIKAAVPGCMVVLVLGKRITSAQLQSVTDSGCDEVLIAPMSADELFDVIAVHLGLPRRGNERFTVEVAVLDGDDARPVESRVTNLSVDGARVVVSEPLPEGTRLRLTVSPESDEQPTEILGEVVWAQEAHGEVTVG